MKQQVVLPRLLKGIWSLMALAPVLSAFDRGIGIRTILAGVLYIAGWVLLRTALARDPGAQELKLFGHSVLARATGTGLALMIVLLGFFGMSIDGLLMLLIAFSVGLFALWGIRRTAAALTQSTQNILLVAFSVVVALCIGEITFRLPVVVARTGGNTPGTDLWTRTHYDELMKKGNRLGLRSFHPDQSKPEGVFRILAMGDSFTWGDKIARTEDTWPYVVEQKLRQKNDHIEVINMGKPGFTTANEAELLDRAGWAFKPDVIVLQFNLNDTLPSGPNYFRETESWLFRTRPLSPVFDEILDQHSYLYSFLNAEYGSLQIQSKYADGYAPLYADNFIGWRQCRDALRQMEEQARQKGVPMLLAIFPSFSFVGKFDDSSYPYLQLHNKVAAAAHEAGFEVLDLEPVYAKFGRPASSWWAMPSDGHPSVEGHRVAGEAIVKKLGELGLVPESKPDGF